MKTMKHWYLLNAANENQMHTEVLLILNTCYLWGPAKPPRWFPLWLMEQGVSNDLSSAQLRVSETGLISAKH
jgi:hypothetical protein